MPPLREALDEARQGASCTERLKVYKKSRHVGCKSSLSPSRSTSSLQAATPQRHPVITYAPAPKVVQTSPSDFMGLVQKLTGPLPSGAGDPRPNSRGVESIKTLKRVSSEPVMFQNAKLWTSKNDQECARKSNNNLHGSESSSSLHNLWMKIDEGVWRETEEFHGDDQDSSCFLPIFDGAINNCFEPPNNSVLLLENKQQQDSACSLPSVEFYIHSSVN
ncbi:hypothetical protein Cni_G11560 [Canna indica]|uniref:VQ domain-containing protein n=1 Tax=Canna indica TaxID=4628 RepID=A0AAQ3Q8A3_9LILI|nr:hypothetical protein Cni_G11560 [Canna indica]